MKEWQFNVLFFVGVGGAVLLLLGPVIGLNISQNPTALAGVGSILTYILTQRKSLTKRDRDRRNQSDNDEEGGEEDDQ
jgi:hypothetical protein